VLVDSEPIANRIFANYLTALNFPHTPKEYNKRFLGISDASARTMIESEGIVLPPTFRAHDILSRDLKPIPGIKNSFGSIDLPICVASSCIPIKITPSLSKTGLLDYFMSHLFSLTQVKNGTPPPDLFLFAAAQMGVAPERLLVIEESLAGVQAGITAQMTMVGFTGGGHFFPGYGATLSALGAHDIIDDMRDLHALLN